MKILITGVSGFVGEEIYNFFSNKPQHKVIGIDKNHDISIDSSNFIKCDLISEKNKLNKIFSDFIPDVVIHCASTILDTYDKNLVWKTNFYATEDLINLASKYKVKKFIFISTFSIFQKNYENPIDESEKPSYRTLYGKTKYLTEQMLLKSNFSGDVCILRCPIIMGKKRAYRFALLFGLIKENNNIPLIGDCKNKLSFIHVVDVCRAVDNFFNCSGKHIFNIAANEHEEFQYILKRLINKVNSKSKLKHFNKAVGNLIFDLITLFRIVPWTSYHKKIFNYSIILDTKKAKNILKWQPTYTVEKMFEENYLNCFKTSTSNPHSFSKKKVKEGFIFKIIKKII